MRVIDGDVGHAPVHLWSSVASEATIRQLRALAAQPYVVGPVAAMADAHLSSSGVAVGTVFATHNELVPDALGDDLGCGVRVVELDLEASSLDARSLQRVLRRLSSVIPAGDRGRSARAVIAADATLLERELSTSALSRRWPTLVARDLATLGGGNHFIELDRDPRDGLWILVHSGSRGAGGAIAEHHRRAAHARAARPLGALDVRLPEGAGFLSDLDAAAAFAAHNRSALAALVRECIAAEIDGPVDERSSFDVAHNTIAREAHDGRSLLVHRKGAVRARVGDRVVIPGSMATATYLADGAGHGPAWCSCSHGAGRVLSRREARERVRGDALIARMGRVVFDRRRARDLVEEAPQAYRDVREVIAEQRALVTATLRLEPVLSFKG